MSVGAIISGWRKCGLLKAHAYDDKNRYLYEPVEPAAVLKHQGIKLTDSSAILDVVPQEMKGVQYEASSLL